MKSPFDELQIEKELICDFFATFMRFEYAMKATRYCRGDRHRNAIPNWNELKTVLGQGICPAKGSSGYEQIAYLVDEPPQVQKYIDGRPQFRAAPLTETTFGASALEAAKRVRNNLFHGGKNTLHSSPERDTKLIRGALSVLEICLTLDADLRTEFEHQLV